MDFCEICSTSEVLVDEVKRDEIEIIKIFEFLRIIFKVGNNPPLWFVIKGLSKEKKLGSPFGALGQRYHKRWHFGGQNFIFGFRRTTLLNKGHLGNLVGH
jgi:hypothetical protein